MSFDTIVLGAGLAGMSAALRLAQSGQRVLVLARGVGAIQLAGGTLDVLGYAPGRVSNWMETGREFVSAHPEHPYARIGLGVVSEALGWFRDRAAPLRYGAPRESRNMLLPTAVGAAKPTAAAPDAMSGGELRAGEGFTIVGLPALKDFFPALVADNLSNLRDVPVRARSLDVRVTPDEADVTPLGFARRFDDAEWRKAVIADLSDRIEEGDAVGFPAVLGLEDPITAWSDLEAGLGAPVFEIPTLPPSVPGIRLFRFLKGALRQAGGRLIIGAEVVGAETGGDRVTGVVVESAARTVSYRAGSFVLATGGFMGGGLRMDADWKVTEEIFGLPVAGAPRPGEERMAAVYFEDNPMDLVGLATDEHLRPADGKGGAAYGNLYAAGAVLGGAAPWREKSGDGISLSSGYFVAGRILEGSG